MKLRLALLLLTICWIAPAVAQSQEDPAEKPEAESFTHYIYIDYEFIWTIEMVGNTPVVNIITFGEGEWPLRPGQIRIYNQQGKRARVKKFSMETGAEPYVTPSFRVLGDSFIAIDLIGEFEDFSKPARIAIDLGPYRYQLEPIDPLAFETLAQQINKINYDSPDIREDYAILKIDHKGKRRLRPRRHR